MRRIKCLVGCKDSEGFPTLVAVRISCTPEEYENGDHYDKAKEAVLEEGYESAEFVMDENDDPMPGLFDLFFSHVSQAEFDIYQAMC